MTQVYTNPYKEFIAAVRDGLKAQILLTKQIRKAEPLNTAQARVKPSDCRRKVRKDPVPENLAAPPDLICSGWEGKGTKLSGGVYDLREEMSLAWHLRCEWVVPVLRDRRILRAVIGGYLARRNRYPGIPVCPKVQLSSMAGRLVRAYTPGFLECLQSALSLRREKLGCREFTEEDLTLEAASRAMGVCTRHFRRYALLAGVQECCDLSLDELIDAIAIHEIAICAPGRKPKIRPIGR